MTTAPLARLFRVDDDHRRRIVTRMLEHHHTEAASYWTQLVLAVGIATFGLVLNSGAVIIGAMLVAPLMGPIVELAMGLAVGSALLVLRSALRIGASVLVAVLSAGVLTRALPFQEVTQEIAARASPTVLDLAVACFCALTAAFVTLKPHDTVTTAAGTSIGISLVPPLCAAGFGVGVRALSISRGALLLFTANFSAILLCALLVFLLAGFGRVDAAALEHGVIRDLDRKGLVVRVADRLNTLLGSRHATVFKLLLPFSLVAAVFVPLQQALATVSAEVRARQKLSAILTEDDELRNALLTTIGFDGGGLSVRLVVVGDPSHAKELEEGLRARVASSIGPGAVVSVIGVPDAAAVVRLAAAAQPPLPPPPSPPVEVAPLVELESRVRGALDRHYPSTEAGPLLRWALSPGAEAPRLQLTHIGPPLGPAGQKLLAEALSGPLHGSVTIVDDALSPEPVQAADAAALAVEARVLALRLAAVPGARLCASFPAVPPRPVAAKPIDRAALAGALGIPEENILAGTSWSIEVRQGDCVKTELPAAAPKDGAGPARPVSSRDAQGGAIP